ncbi:MAG TPA: TlpA disulfide reductase family protein, partial [Thermoanaerobaculia bacterium]|nr:TlpA disulfide reductase family protein [Thermoanaerobaculia bacterium]
MKRFLSGVLIAGCAWSALADRAPFKAGLPDFPPLKKAVTMPRTATLPKTSDGVFHVVTGFGAGGATVWWMIHKKPDRTVALLPLTMQVDAAGTRTTTMELELDGASNATKRLELSVSRERDVLDYRWLTGEASTIAVGQPLPEFDLNAPDGGTLRLAELQGPIVVLNSWATWCVPCVEEMPSLNRLVGKYASRGVEFVAILQPNQPADLTAFLEKHPFAYRQTIGTDSSHRVFGDAYPRHVILGADGTVA